MSQHLLACLLLAAASAHSLRGQQPSFRVFTTQDGLVRNWVTKIRRDSKGYLWFCTVEGISLFDGYRFTNFSTRDGLPNRLVLDMIETRQGEYWFATQAGLARFHPQHGNGPAFDRIRVGGSAASNIVHALHQSRNGTIWCATAGGLYSFQPGDRDPVPYLTPLGSLASPDVYALVEDSRQNLWVATSSGLLRRRPNREIDTIPIPLSRQMVNSMVVDGHDRLWAGGYGLVGIDTATEPPHLLPSTNFPDLTAEGINVLLENGDEIWIGRKTGLVRFRPDASPPDTLAYQASDSFPIQDVLAIGRDGHRNLWLGVGTLGVVRIAAGSFQLFTPADGLESSEVFGMMESARGTLYAITGQWTLNEVRGDRFLATALQVPRRGTTWAQGQTIVQDREGAWWAASGNGLLRYAAVRDAAGLAGRAPERIYSVGDGLPSPVILRVFQDSRGDIWAGTSNGVGYWNRDTGRWLGFSSDQLIHGAGAVHSIAEDRSGAVWIGMSPGGLVRFRGQVWDLVSKDVPPGGINALLSDSHGRLWIGSSQGGVGRMNKPSDAEPRIDRYGLQQGLLSEHVFSLAEDAWGRIYVAGGRGVDRLDLGTATLHHFTTSSGLPPGDTQFLFRDRQGSIWFASFYGLARYWPEPNPNSETAAPLLRTVRMGGERYPLSEIGERMVTGVELTPGRNNLEIEFRALHFDSGEDLRYQYRLEGADGEWSEPSSNQTVRYASLSPGSYRFAVRSITESGLVSEGQATLAFRVLPVFWRRSWFLGLLMTAIASGAVFLHRYRVNHLLALERVRTRVATDLHDDLGTGLAEIAILIEVAKRQERHRTLEMLDGIADRARSLRGAMADIVWTVDPRENRLADLVARLRQTAFTMLENEERRVEFLAPVEECLELELAPDVRRHLLLFFKEAVTNVARHAKATAVQVEIEAGQGYLRMSVRDNGCGFDQRQPRSGCGLKSLQYRAGELGGTFRMESVVEGGTQIELSLKL